MESVTEATRLARLRQLLAGALLSTAVGLLPTWMGMADYRFWPEVTSALETITLPADPSNVVTHVIDGHNPRLTPNHVIDGSR